MSNKKYLQITFSEDVMKRLKQKAKNAGLSLASWARMILISAAGKKRNED